MIPTPRLILCQFDQKLIEKTIPDRYRNHYRKWLNYYLNYCVKYHLEQSDRNHVVGFIAKLHEKNQPKPYQTQAVHAISLYLELKEAKTTSSPTEQHNQSATRTHQTQSHTAQATPQVTSSPTSSDKTDPSTAATDTTPPPLQLTGGDWTPMYKILESSIKVRHYSPKTLKAYRGWIHHLQNFVKSKDSKLLEISDVKDFLSFFGSHA